MFLLQRSQSNCFLVVESFHLSEHFVTGLLLLDCWREPNEIQWDGLIRWAQLNLVSIYLKLCLIPILRLPNFSIAGRLNVFLATDL